MTDGDAANPSFRDANPSFRDAVERARERVRIDLLAEWWLLSKGNALFAWEAYRLCRKHGDPFPQWLLAYLDVTAEALASLDPDLPLKRSEHEVAKALGLSGKPANWRRRHEEAVNTAFDVLTMIDDDLNDGKTITKLDPYLHAAAQKTGTSKNTIRNWCETHAPEVFQKRTPRS